MDTIFTQRARALLQSGLDLLFPPHCVGCQRSGSLLCRLCWQTMQPLSIPFCQHCGTPLATVQENCTACAYRRCRLHELRCVNSYQGALRKAIHALKYTGCLRLAEPLGLLLAEAFQQYGMCADGIMPLPLHPSRQQQRGYNQSALLARACATRLKVPYLENLVLRQRDTLPQVSLTSHERLQNVAGAFILAPNARARLSGYRSLLLIDDVSTTGATLEACAAPLYAVGVQQVRGLVLSRPNSQAQDGSKGML